MFLEFWPLIQKHMPDRDERVEFTSGLLALMVREDMDSYDIEDVHPDVRAALRLAGIELCEPERYADES